MFRRHILTTLAVAALGSAALAAPANQPAGTAKAALPEASVPFVNQGVVDDFRPDGDQAVYLRANGFHWYHAKLMAPCPDLRFAERIGVETRGPDTLDRFATLLVRGQRCPLTSLVKADAPPAKAAKAKPADKPGR